MGNCNSSGESSPTRVLLLGTEASGKTTFCKQVVRTFGGGFLKDERLTTGHVIQSNILHRILTVLRDLDEEAGKPVAADGRDLIETVAQCEFDYMEGDRFVSEVGEAIASVLKHADLQRVLNADFYKAPWDYKFFNDVSRIFAKDWEPTDSDILNCRKPTVGQCAYGPFDVSPRLSLTLVDVGGQRTERKSWLNEIEKADSIVFLVSATDYTGEKVSDGDYYNYLSNDGNDKHKLDEALDLFGGIFASETTRKKPVVMLITKVDLFTEMVQRGKPALKDCFPDYNGKDFDVHDAEQYVTSKIVTVAEKANFLKSQVLSIYRVNLLDTISFRRLILDIERSILAAKQALSEDINVDSIDDKVATKRMRGTSARNRANSMQLVQISNPENKTAPELWRHAVENVNGVVFIFNLMDYKQPELMKESHLLFKRIVGSQKLKDTKKFLLMTHFSEFEESLKQQPLDEYFDDYLGAEDADSCMIYIRNTFRQSTLPNNIIESEKLFTTFTVSSDDGSFKAAVQSIASTLITDMYCPISNGGRSVSPSSTADATTAATSSPSTASDGCHSASNGTAEHSTNARAIGADGSNSTNSSASGTSAAAAQDANGHSVSKNSRGQFPKLLVMGRDPKSRESFFAKVEEIFSGQRTERTDGDAGVNEIVVDGTATAAVGGDTANGTNGVAGDGSGGMAPISIISPGKETSVTSFLNVINITAEKHNREVWRGVIQDATLVFYMSSAALNSEELSESLTLFTRVINSSKMSHLPIVIFLTKTDLLDPATRDTTLAGIQEDFKRIINTQPNRKVFICSGSLNDETTMNSQVWPVINAAVESTNTAGPRKSRGTLGDNFVDKLLLLGHSSSGKTTLMQMLNKRITGSSTIVTKLSQYQQLAMFMVVGIPKDHVLAPRAVWEAGIQNLKVVVFLVSLPNMSDSGYSQAAIQKFVRIFNSRKIRKVPVVLLFNKQDQFGALYSSDVSMRGDICKYANRFQVAINERGYDPNTKPFTWFTSSATETASFKSTFIAIMREAGGTSADGAIGPKILLTGMPMSGKREFANNIEKCFGDPNAVGSGVAGSAAGAQQQTAPDGWQSWRRMSVALTS